MLITVRAYIWKALVYISKAVQPSSNNSSKFSSRRPILVGSALLDYRLE